MIHLHRLRLTGPNRQYNVDFDRCGSNLAIIAGPIHTGKTTILEFVDYLLGNDEHPTHPEVARTVRSAELELSVEARRYTIERPLFSSEQVAYVRDGRIGVAGAGRRKIIEPPGDPSSLSYWLLSAIGLEGSKVRVTEGNPNSPAHNLSFRDVMWLAYLTSTRLDNKALLHEGHEQKRYKLQQVVELLFDIHDDRLAQLLDQQKQLRAERIEHEREVAAIESFLAEENVPTQQSLNERRAAIAEELAGVDAELEQALQHGSAATSGAAQLRRRYGLARAASTRAAARRRDREALLERLLPLRAQYAEDERKLVFFDEAKRLFDPLTVTHCPACLHELRESPTTEGGRCSLCQQELQMGEEHAFELDRERRALRARIRDLDAYADRVERQIEVARREYTRLTAQEEALAKELDDQTAQKLSPFVARRERLVRQRGALVAEASELARALRWYEALERRREQTRQVIGRLVEIQSAMESLRSARPDREAVVQSLSARFSSLLREWGFPKIEDPEGPFLDDKFVPYVRGRVYRAIGSDGALTLIALAWELSVFEEAIERGASHPGFLMLDSVQKNLAPASTEKRDEYADPAIVQRMYDHIAKWAASHPLAQLILVDHEPPASVETHVIVRYTRRPDAPPYGLIVDQTG